MQPKLVAGDSLDFLTTVEAYPPAAGWTLKHRLVPRAAGTAISLTATTSGTDYQTTASPTTTAAWALGEYAWSSWVEKTGYRHTVSSGQLTITPDPGVMAAGTDTRGQAEKAVADLKAAFATYTASQGHVTEYEIAGRRMRFSSSAEIVEKLSFWQGEFVKERAASAAAMGLPDPRKIYLRAGRA
jgi:enamine deaminase RidA (YjgF/YER057c/UK114 family)